MKITSFKINKLHGTLNFELNFEDNTLIVLGENGSCKTTIIKMLYYTLSLQLGKLSQYNFESIDITIDAEKIHIDKKDCLSFPISIDRDLLRKLPPSVRRYILSTLEQKGTIGISELEQISRRYDIPLEFIFQKLNIDNPELDFCLKELGEPNVSNQLRGSILRLKEKVSEIQILYLPTYRRIEQELKVIFDGRIDEDEFMFQRRTSYKDRNNYSELIEFGMRDVDDAINDVLTYLKDSSRSNLNKLTLGYLGAIVGKEYDTIHAEELSEIDNDTIHQIMNRVDQSILSEERKSKLFETLQQIKERGIQSEHDKVVCHYFLKLYDSHKELNYKETNIRAFVDVCNKYLNNKKLYYDSPSFSFSIKSNNDNSDIQLFQLSSGEKQIVSLFGHLYLSSKSNYIVLIDEPELSLSVKWQKIFLEDVKNGGFCYGLVAVTHSPFIFHNSLDKYAHSIEEFKK